MQKIGEAASEGFTYGDLVDIQQQLKIQDIESSIYDLGWPVRDLHPELDAYFLLVPGGVEHLIANVGNTDNLFKELVELEWDTKALM